MTATATYVAPAEIRTLPVRLDDRTYQLKYPYSPVMEEVIVEILQKEEYPTLPFLNQRPGVILDIGANIGTTTLLFHLRYPGKEVYSFEPSTSTYPFLRENAAPLPGVHAFDFGLYNRDCATRLYTGAHGSVTSSICDSQLNGGDYEEIHLRRASTVVEELGIDRIALLKIDTEGAEVPVLRDMEHLLDRVDAIFFEYHSERDRIELDRLLCERFQLHHATNILPHRGTLGYVAKEVIASLTDLNRYEIPRPTL